MLYFTSNPLVGPHFLRRTPQGWVLDIYAEILDTRNYTGEAYAWGLVESGDDFTVAFADRFVEIGSILRLAGGDNRPLPMRTISGLTVRPAASGEPEPPTGIPVEQLAVPDLAKRILSQESRPLLVMLYYSQGRNSREVFLLLVEVARACKLAGADVLALSIDDRPEYVRRLPGFLRQHSADFPPLHLQPWPSGHLAGALDPMGFQIGRAFATPLVAVRNHGGVAIQAGGAAQVAAWADDLIQACTATPGVVADIGRAR